MARISGIVLPAQKRIIIGLTYVYGIGPVKAQAILEETQIDPDLRVKDLSSDQEVKLQSAIDKDHQVEGDLRREVLGNVKRLKEIGTYRGERHTKKLPVRGQRTKTNARTKRGKKVTIGSGRKKAVAKK